MARDIPLNQSSFMILGNLLALRFCPRNFQIPSGFNGCFLCNARVAFRINVAWTIQVIDVLVDPVSQFLRRPDVGQFYCNALLYCPLSHGARSLFPRNEEHTSTRVPGQHPSNRHLVPREILGGTGGGEPEELSSPPTNRSPHSATGGPELCALGGQQCHLAGVRRRSVFPSR